MMLNCGWPNLVSAFLYLILVYSTFQQPHLPCPQHRPTPCIPFTHPILREPCCQIDILNYGPEHLPGIQQPVVHLSLLVCTHHSVAAHGTVSWRFALLFYDCEWKMAKWKHWYQRWKTTLQWKLWGVQKQPTLNLSQPYLGRKPAGHAPVWRIRTQHRVHAQSWKIASKVQGVIRDFLVFSAQGEQDPSHIPFAFPGRTESVARLHVSSAACLVAVVVIVF